MHSQAVLGDADTVQRIEEQTGLRQREAVLAINAAFQRMSGATPETFEELRTALEQTLRVQLPDVGPQQQLLRAGADRVLEAATQHVARMRELERMHREEEERTNQRRVQQLEATFAMRSAIERLSGATAESFETLRDELEQAMRTHLPATGARQDVLRSSAEHMLQAAQQWIDLATLEAGKKQEEEERLIIKFLREQEAVLLVKKATQALANASPESFDRLKADLDQVLASELPETGAQREVLTQGAANVLTTAQAAVEDAKEASQQLREEEQATLRRVEATLKLRQAVQRLAGADPENFEVLKLDLEQALATGIPHAGEDREVLKEGATRVLGAAQEVIEQMREDRQKKAGEERKVLREQEATLAVRRMMQQVAGAGPETLAAVEAEMAQLLQSELPDVGERGEVLRRGAEKALENAKLHLAQVKEEEQRRKEQEPKLVGKILRQQDATLAIRIVLAKLAGANASNYEQLKDELEKVLTSELPGTGAQRVTLKAGADRVLEASRQYVEKTNELDQAAATQMATALEAHAVCQQETTEAVVRRHQEAAASLEAASGRHRQEAEAHVRQHEATFAVRAAVQALAHADATNFESLRQDLERVLAAELPACGPNTEALKAGVSRAIEAARKHVEQVRALAERKSLEQALAEVRGKKRVAAAAEKYAEAEALRVQEASLLDQIAMLGPAGTTGDDRVHVVEAVEAVAAASPPNSVAAI